MSPIQKTVAAQPLDLPARSLPLIQAASAGLQLLARPPAQRLAHLLTLVSTRLRADRPHLQRGDEPGLAVLRELGLDREPRQAGFDHVDIHPGLESRARFLDTSQGWRGS